MTIEKNNKINLPYIYRKPKIVKNNHNKTLAQKYVYNTTRWHNLRMYKIQQDPLCEECLLINKIVPAVEVHHITPFMTGRDINQIKWLGFDYTNLQSLCSECHNNKHK